MKYVFKLQEDGTVKSAEWNHSECGYSCTNSEGEGVFYVNLKRNERTQSVGTCDFSVKGCTKDAARRRIRKLYEGEGDNEC